MKTVMKAVIPLLIIALAALVFKWQMSNRPEPKKKPRKKITPVVMVEKAEYIDDFRYEVRGYGSVQPAKSVSVVSEVAGKIIWVNKKLKTGGQFRKGEGLYRVDDTEYVAALDARISTLKSAQLSLQEVIENADVSVKEWEIWNRTAGEEKIPSLLVSYKPQLEAAEAAVKSAESAVVSAKTDLAKVLYKAPFNCVVTEESIEYGKIIRVGESAGTLIGYEKFEVYVPVAGKDAVMLTFSDDKRSASKGYIELTEGDVNWRWPVYVERVLPDADGSTGMLRAVLIVEKPFNTANGTRPVLPIGANVKAYIGSTKRESAVKISEKALREGGSVWVVSHDSRLQIRDVSIKERRGDDIYISSGIVEGERVIVSSLKGAVDGMRIEVFKMKKRGKAQGGAK